MKLFVFDVDGTLVGISQRLRKKTIEALNSILDNGDAIAIASGRNFSGIKKYLEKLHDGKKFLIVANGAALYDYEGNNIYSLCVDDKVLFDIRNSLSYLINEKKASIYCYVENDLGYFEYTRWIINEKVANRISTRNLNKNPLTINDKIFKIMIAGGKEVSAQINLEEDIINNNHVVRSNAFFIEIVNKNADKSYGVSKLMEYLGIDKSDVYTFGDAGNDYLMIKNFNGIAMGNATDEIKKVAKYTTKSVLENGVAYAINNIVKYQKS